jgi:hypothetical protein
MYNFTEVSAFVKMLLGSYGPDGALGWGDSASPSNRMRVAEMLRME